MASKNNNNNDNKSNRLNDNYILLINAIPYLFDFIAGLVSIVLIYRIAIFNDLIKEKIRWEKGISEIGLTEKVLFFMYIIIIIKD